MTWQIALGLFYVVVIAQSLLQRSYSQKSKLPESFPPAISYLLGVTPLGIILGLMLGHHVQWSWWLVSLLIGEGVFIGLYNWLSFMAIRRLPLARFQTIYQSYEIVVILLGWTVLSEKLTVGQICGGVLLLVAALLAIRAPRKAQVEGAQPRRIPSTGTLLAIASAVALGIGLVIEKTALRHMDMGAYFIFGYATQTLSLLVIAVKDAKTRALKQFKLYDLKRSLSMGVLSATIGFFYIIAIVKSDNISLITALSAFTLPLTVFAGFLILHEKEDKPRLWTAMAIGFAGLIIGALW